MRKRPNLLVILASGLRCDLLGSEPRWPLKIPHLNNLVDYGLTVSAIAASPAATPARLSLFTGLHVRQHGVTDEGLPVPRLPTWISQLADSGYLTMGVGQLGLVHHHFHEVCYVADVASLDHPACAYIAHMRRRGLADRVYQQRHQRLRTGPFEMNPAGLTAPADDVDGFIAQQASLSLERLPTDRPWCLVTAFTGPGNDLPAPISHVRNVHASPLTDGFVPADMRRVDDFAHLPYPHALYQHIGPATIANIRRHYLARTMLIDQAVGSLREILDRNGHTRDTWIVLASDHGRLLGERGIVGARSMLGPALCVPMIFLPPAGRPDNELALDQQLVSTVDLAPTLCRIGQVEPPRFGPGHSLIPMLSGEVVGRTAQISEFASWLALETLQHRIVFDTDRQQPLMIFDLLEDPDERRDLLGTPAGSNVIDMLRWQLAGELMPLRPIRAA